MIGKVKKIFKAIVSGKAETYLYMMTIRKRKALSETDVFKIQDQFLHNMMKYAVKNCAYYREFFSNAIPQEISSFPIVSKDIIRKDTGAFCSDKKNYFFHGDAYTGGSTGEPFHLLIGGVRD